MIPKILQKHKLLSRKTRNIGISGTNIGDRQTNIGEYRGQTKYLRSGSNGVKSVLFEPSAKTMLAVAAYIDLNPIRAGLASDPKDYRFSSYGAAVGGSRNARLGLRQLMCVDKKTSRTSWGNTQQTYRQHLYMPGQQKELDPEGHPIRQGFTPEQIQAVVKADVNCGQSLIASHSLTIPACP